MKVDGGVGWQLDKAGAEARALEEMGYSGVLSAETGHDPFFPLLMAAQTTHSHRPDDLHRGGVRALAHDACQCGP